MHADEAAYVDARMKQLRDRLMTLQNADGGFKGFRFDDIESGLWTTASIVEVVSRTFPGEESDRLRRACEYLQRHQNADGGWPFRPRGKSITDMTAWCCLALSHHGFAEEIRRGVEFLIQTRRNAGEVSEDGWGLTTFECDRVYSTMMASECLTHLIRSHSALFDEARLGEMQTALTEARAWIKSIRNPDGGWGPTRSATTTFTNTAMALLTLFAQGENPVDFATSCDVLRRGVHQGLWDMECDLVVTQEGYELNQEWFTSAYCFRAMIYFAEMGVATLDEADASYQGLIDLVHEDGRVELTRGASSEFAWPLAYTLEALERFRGFVKSKQREYRAFMERKREALLQGKKQAMEDLLHRHVPYPVSHAFSEFEHELDYHRKFELLLQLYEITVKYATIVGVSGCLAAKEQHAAVNSLLAERFKRPSLGDWGALLESLLKESPGLAKLLLPLRVESIIGARPDYLDEHARKENLNQTLSAIVANRNTSVGHGALRSLFEYKQMVEAEQGRLYSFFDRLLFLAKSNSFLVLESKYDEFGDGDTYRIRIFKGLNIQDNDLETDSRLSGGQKESMIRYIYFQNTANNTIVNLYPFLSYMFCDECKREHFFFFNGLRSGEDVQYLSYECGHHSERANVEHFRKRLKLVGVEW